MKFESFFLVFTTILEFSIAETRREILVGKKCCAKMSEREKTFSFDIFGNEKKRICMGSLTRVLFVNREKSAGK